MLFALLFSVAHAFQCEGVSSSDMRHLLRNDSPVHFGEQVRVNVGTRGCTGIQDAPAYFYFAPRKQVWFFECRAGQIWWDPDDNVGGANCL